MTKAFVLLCLLMGMTFATTAIAQPLAPARAHQLEQSIKTAMKKYHIPGFSIQISQGPQRLYARAFGYRNKQSGARMKTSTPSRIASISKPITALAVYQLYGSHQLSPQTKIYSLLGLQGASDTRWKQITVQELIDHQGGFNRDKSFDPMFRTVMLGLVKPTCSSITAVMLTRPLDFNPGSKSAYSNFGYCLLSLAISKVSHTSYVQYVKQHILKPLRMTHTYTGRTLIADRPSKEARYYDYKGAPLVASVFDPAHLVPDPDGGFSIEAFEGAGNWVSTTGDLIRFSEGLRTNTKHLVDPGLYVGHVPPFPPAGDGWWWYFTGSFPGARSVVYHNGNYSWSFMFNTRPGDGGEPLIDKLDAKLKKLLHTPYR